MQETRFLKNNERVLKDIKKFEIFEPFQDNELLNLLSMSKITRYKPGETIFNQGSCDTWIYFLIYGTVRLLKDGKVVALFKNRGDVFGEMGAIDCAPRSASAIAIVETVCLASDIYYIEQLSGDEKSSFGYVIYRVLSSLLTKRLRNTTSELMETRSAGLNILKNSINSARG
jgi:CRP/FNR family cyclic AMP-dependent transcriptional regulator